MTNFENQSFGGQRTGPTEEELIRQKELAKHNALKSEFQALLLKFKKLPTNQQSESVRDTMGLIRSIVNDSILGTAKSLAEYDSIYQNLNKQT